MENINKNCKIIKKKYIKRKNSEIIPYYHACFGLVPK